MSCIPTKKCKAIKKQFLSGLKDLKPIRVRVIEVFYYFGSPQIDMYQVVCWKIFNGKKFGYVFLFKRSKTKTVIRKMYRTIKKKEKEKYPCK